MILVGFGLLIVVTAFVMHRRARMGTLAGRNSDKPVYSIEPPARRVGDRRRERL